MVFKDSYYRNDYGNIIWDLTGISIWENKNDKNYLSIIRATVPEKELPDNFHDEWNDLVKRKYPYNRETQLEGSQTYISDLHNKFASLSDYDKEHLKKVYSLGLSFEGKIDDKIMKDKFGILDSTITVHEEPIPVKKGNLRH